MEVIEKDFKYARPDVFKVYTMGDEHLGTKHCSEKEILKHVNQIKNDPFAYWVGMGDKAEFITPIDPRWDVDVIADYVHPDNIAYDQSERYCDIYSPITHKCLGLIEGNHEDSIRAHSHIDVQKNICKRLGVPNLGYSAFIKILFQRSGGHVEKIVGFFTHGAGCATTKGAKLNRLQRVMDSFEADIYAHGHVHDIITDNKSYITLDQNNKIKQKEKYGAMTGCFFTTYSQGVRASYGEKKNYPPTIIGCPIFTIIPDKGIISVGGSH